jgi:hypothetical protein
MTDREKIIALLESAEVEFENWNERMITVDERLVEFHFNSDGSLKEIVGVET